MSPERWAARPEVLRDVSEWAAQELVVALSISAEAAEALLVRSLTLVHRLPGTLAALEAGALHPGHLWPMLEKVAPIENDTVRAEVEAELLRWSAGRVTTPAQLGAKARREVLRRDARAAARQLEKAIKERGVHVRPGAVDGMATVTALLTAPEASALVQALGRVRRCAPGRPRRSAAPGARRWPTVCWTWCFARASATWPRCRSCCTSWHRSARWRAATSPARSTDTWCPPR